MRRIVYWIIVFSMFAANRVGVLADNPPLPPGARQADLHNPFSNRSIDFRPNGLARRTAAGVNSHGQGHHQGHGQIGGFGFYPSYYTPGYGGYYPTYYSTPYYTRPYVYAPQTNIFNTTIFQPTREVAVPGVVNRAPRIVNRGVAPEINRRSRELSHRFIGFGDDQFAQGKYVDAQLRYRKAIKAAPNLAEAYLRRGQAMIALGRYDLAATALKQGLNLKSMRTLGEYRLDNLYGADKDAKQKHLDAILREIDRQPLNADLEFLAAWQMYFGGQREASGAHFRRAATLAGNLAHLEDFLAATKPIEAELPPAQEPGDPAQEQDANDAPDARDAPKKQPPDDVGQGVEI